MFQVDVKRLMYPEHIRTEQKEENILTRGTIKHFVIVNGISQSNSYAYDNSNVSELKRCKNDLEISVVRLSNF